MKKFILISVTMAFLFAGCHKDNSNHKTTIAPDTGSSIITFTVNSSPAVTANLKDKAFTFAYNTPPGTDPGLLTANITISPNATITPAGSVAQDFTSPVTYNLKAQNGKTNSYQVNATPPNTPKFVPAAPKKLAIYYGYPSLVNGSNYNLNTASSVFAQFDVIVLGDQLYKPSHPDHNNTQTIISLLKQAKPGIKIFGYIDVGSTQNLTASQLTQAIDQWAAIGVTGVFGDEFGYDFNNSRTRQNAFIDYAHGKSLAVFANSYQPADALGADQATGATHLKAGDYYLLENFIMYNGQVNIADYQTRGQKAYYYMRTAGVSIAVSASVPSGSLPASGNNTSDAFQFAWTGTVMYNFDAFQLSDPNYSASNNVLQMYNNPLSTYGTSWKQYDWVTQTSTGFTRSTDKETFAITATGKGSHTP